MRVSTVVNTKLSELALEVIEGRVEHVDAAEEMAIWIEREDPNLARSIVTNWARTEIRNVVRLRTQVALAGDDSAGEQLKMIFTELPPHLEVGVGVFKHQSVMVLKDWANCVAIVRNRADQAELIAQKIERRYQQLVDAGMTGNMTTLEVLEALHATA